MMIEWIYEREAKKLECYVELKGLDRLIGVFLCREAVNVIG